MEPDTDRTGSGQEPVSAFFDEERTVEAAEVEEAAPPEPAAPPTDRLPRVLLGFVAVTLAVSLGAWIFVGTPTVLALAPIVGIAAALACERELDAAVVAALGTVSGTLLGSVLSALSWYGIENWLPDTLRAAVMAALVAAAAAWALRRSPRLHGVLAAAALMLVIASGWYATVTAATTPAADGTTYVGLISTTPPITATTIDERLYRIYIERLRQGQGYYQAVAGVLTEANAVRAGMIDVASPLSFRLPTLYVALAALPAGGIWWVVGMLATMTVATASAFVLARRVVVVPLALAAAAAVAAYYSSVAVNIAMFGTEMWAGALALAACALFASAHAATGGRRRALVWAAAAVALLGALIRELGAAFLILGLVATLVDEEDRDGRLWMPWAASLAVAAVVYWLHWSAAAQVIAALHVARIGRAMPWFNPDGRGLVSAIGRVATMTALKVPVAWALTLLAAVGAIVGVRDRGTRILLGGAVVGGCILLLFMYPPGVSSTSDLPPGYWGDMIAPILLACVPLAFAFMPGARREREPADDYASATAPAGGS